MWFLQFTKGWTMHALLLPSSSQNHPPSFSIPISHTKSVFTFLINNLKNHWLWHFFFIPKTKKEFSRDCGLFCGWYFVCSPASGPIIIIKLLRYQLRSPISICDNTCSARSCRRKNTQTASGKLARQKLVYQRQVFKHKSSALSN